MSELKEIKQEEKEFVFGSAVTFAEMEQFLLPLKTKDEKGAYVMLSVKMLLQNYAFMLVQYIAKQV